MKLVNLEGAVIPVSGAASGIGLAICKRLKAEGGKPILLDIDAAKLDAAIAEIYPDGPASPPCGYVLDIRDPQAIDACFDRIEQDHGQIAHAVANAGILIDAGILDITNQQWLSVIDVNLNGTLFFCRAAARQLAKAGEGSIVTMSSVAGFGARENRLAYSSSKAAVINLTKALALDLGKYNVRVNSIAPGAIDTPLQSHKSGAQRQTSIGRTALGRSGSPDEIAKVVVFLLSDLASYVSGETIAVDGGMLTRYN